MPSRAEPAAASRLRIGAHQIKHLVTARRQLGRYHRQLNRAFSTGERVCGSGRFSNVYVAELVEPEARKVAIKNSWEPKNVAAAKDKLYPEIEILANIPPNPNIVTLLYHFTRRIEQQLYSYQLFSAVKWLFKCRVVHLDIKPSNLVLNHTYVGANFDPKALALLQGVLIYDPSKRRTAEQVLKHDYFEPLRQEDQGSDSPETSHR
ncbi:hypothetical protein Q1695_001742 [Nippostrongylus brasiliensis]|nr:hypothetical protein Q1695_001742 [Nippostrongylus brasiliensis]